MGGNGKGGYKQLIHPKEIPPPQKVFIGGLPELGSEGLSTELNKKLHQHFSTAGKCIYAEIGRKGTGVACFSRKDDAANAVTLLNKSLFDDSYTLTVAAWGHGTSATQSSRPDKRYVQVTH